MENGTNKPAGEALASADSSYVTPAVIELGDVVDLARGASTDNTADANNYYH